MGWAESPPYFCAATETVADLANSRLQDPSHVPEEHHLDDLAHATPAENAVPTTHASSSAVAVPTERDPCLQRSSTTPLQYVDIFVDDFVSAAQKPFLRRVRRTLLRAIDDVFREGTSSGWLCCVFTPVISVFLPEDHLTNHGQSVTNDVSFFWRTISPAAFFLECEVAALEHRMQPLSLLPALK